MSFTFYSEWNTNKQKTHIDVLGPKAIYYVLINTILHKILLIFLMNTFTGIWNGTQYLTRRSDFDWDHMFPLLEYGMESHFIRPPKK